MTTLTWHIAQVTQAGRRAAIALREHRFTVYCPMERIYRNVPKGPREEVERPLFPGYLFVGLGPWNDYDQLYDIDGDGTITYQEMLSMCNGSHSHCSRYLQDDGSDGQAP